MAKEKKEKKEKKDQKDKRDKKDKKDKKEKKEKEKRNTQQRQDQVNEKIFEKQEKKQEKKITTPSASNSSRKRSRSQSPKGKQLIEQSKKLASPLKQVFKTNSEIKSQSSPEQQENIDEELQKLFGFTQFGSTKGKDHSASATEGIFKARNEKRKYRQYMHRRGGFNRLLDEMK